MGNSKTSRYADGRELYEPTALRSALESHVARLARAADQELLDGLTAAARQADRRGPAGARRALRRAPEPMALAPRRFQGEIARVLLDPATAPRIERLARRHRSDEGDVALLWVQTIARSAQPVVTLGLPDGEAAPA